MTIQINVEDVIVVNLPPEPGMGEELTVLIDAVQQRDDSDVVIDFSNVAIVTSTNLSRLIRLRQLTGDTGRDLILCCVSPTTAGVFVVTGLNEIFEMCDSVSEAMARLRPAGENPA